MTTQQQQQQIIASLTRTVRPGNGIVGMRTVTVEADTLNLVLEQAQIPFCVEHDEPRNFTLPELRRSRQDSHNVGESK